MKYLISSGKVSPVFYKDISATNLTLNSRTDFCYFKGQLITEDGIGSVLVTL